MNIKRHTLRTLTALLAAVVCIACAKYKIIPDKTLASIFHDAFLTNAYLENRRFSLDSLDIYQPVFAKYGYTTEDVQYTIGNFSKRKSARLGDVVEEAIKRLEEEGKYYEREVAVLDTIDNIARRRYTRVVYTDSLIRVAGLKDTARLIIELDDIRKGDYRIAFEYKVDSLDNNVSRRMSAEFVRADSSRFGRQQQTLYKRTSTDKVSRTLTSDTSARRLRINLMEFTRPKQSESDKNRNKSKKNTVRDHTGITVTGLTVTYIPDTAIAVDSLFESQLPLRIFFEDFYPQRELRDTVPADTTPAAEE